MRIVSQNNQAVNVSGLHSGQQLKKATLPTSFLPAGSIDLLFWCLVVSHSDRKPVYVVRCSVTYGSA